MHKNQLQELAQRSCFNLPSYACIREGPDHAPRFKASVNFHGEIFDGPGYCPTVRLAEHAAAEVALNNLSTRARGTSKSLAARVLVKRSHLAASFVLNCVIFCCHFAQKCSLLFLSLTEYCYFVDLQKDLHLS